MAYGEELLYEENERGERVVVKSTDSTHRAYIRFTNCTSRRVNLWWRDFQGVRRYYVLIKPGKHFDINTFLTHPWEFTDHKTNEAYVVNNKTVFRAPARIANMKFRTNWNITVPVRTLRQTALLSIAVLLPNVQSADILELPRDLATDLRLITSKLKRPATDQQTE